MRILVMTDSPFSPTGQARVGREIAVGLAERGHELGYIGWWHKPEVSPSLPYNIQFWWTNNSYHGADVFDTVVTRFQPEVVITIADFWNIGYIADGNVCRTRGSFQWCSYIPVDGEPACGGLPPAIAKVVADIDIPVAYTNYAENAVLKSVSDQETRTRIRTIYHGVDTNVFKPAEAAVRLETRRNFGLDGKFMFLTVCRNQSRKNIPELFRAWKIFSELPEVRGRVVLWPHMNFKDQSGWDIEDLIQVYGLRDTNSIMYYDQIAFGESYQYMLPEAELAKLYQISDAFVLLSSEGFGLPTLEAMATRLPCVLLDHAASSEIGAEGRAELVKPSGSVTWLGRYLTEKPLPSIDETVAALLRIFRDKKHRDEVARKGYEFAQRCTWTAALDQWNMLFLEREVPFIKPLKMEVVV